MGNDLFMFYIYSMEESVRNHIVFLNISSCVYNVTIPIEYIYIYTANLYFLLDMQTMFNKICKFAGLSIGTIARIFNQT